MGWEIRIDPTFKAISATLLEVPGRSLDLLEPEGFPETLFLGSGRAETIGRTAKTLRHWFRQAEPDAGQRP